MNTYTTSIRNQFCPNPSCDFYQKLLAENVVVHSQYSKRMRCKSCGKTWVTHRNEMQYGLRAPPQKIYVAVEMFKNGSSIRTIAKKIIVSTSTVQRWKRKFKTF